MEKKDKERHIVVCPECGAKLLRTSEKQIVSGSVSHCGFTVRFTQSHSWVETLLPQRIYDSNASLEDKERKLRGLISSINARLGDVHMLSEHKHNAGLLLKRVIDARGRAEVVGSEREQILFLKTAPITTSKAGEIWRGSVWAMVRFMISQGQHEECNVEETYRSYDQCASFLRAKFPSLPLPAEVAPFVSKENGGSR